MTKYYKTKREELFFEPQIRDLQTINSNKIIVIPEFKAIMNGGDCLGVRRKPVDAEECQYYEHEFAYEAAADMAKAIDKEISVSWSYKTFTRNEAIIFLGRYTNSNDTSEDNTSKEADNSSDSSSHHYVELYHPEDNFLHYNEKLQNLTPDKDLLDLFYFGFQPTIAVKNEYTYDGRSIFYLLVEPTDNNRHKFKAYLTIAKFTFSEKTVMNMQTTDRDAVKYLGERAVSFNGVSQFQFAIRDFIENFEKLQNIEATEEELTAVALDIYNKNRSIQTVLSDEKVYKNIFEFIQLAEGYFIGKENMSELINFIVRYNFFDFSKDTITDNDFKDVLSEKRAYRNLKRLFTAKNVDEKEVKKYIAEQVQIYRSLKELKK